MSGVDWEEIQANESAAARRRRARRRGLLIVFLAIAYASLLFWLMWVPESLSQPAGATQVWWLLWAGAAAFALRKLPRLGTRVAFELLVLALLPAWGAVLNLFLTPCRYDVCDNVLDLQRPFATPEVFWFVGLHELCSLGYLVSRRRPEALPVATEALVLASLLVGIFVDAVAAIQTITLLPYLVALPATLPLMAPIAALVLMLRELRARLLRRARETLGQNAGDLDANSVVPADGVSRWSSRSGRLALWLPLPLVGLYATLEALYLGHADAFVSVVTNTCTHPFSRGTLEIVREQHCHYLCTVAARGHARLVRPLRYGQRRGQRIVVNRQLQLANAFEDLLHERWPRLGRVARTTYDRLGLPMSRYIRGAYAADLVYLAMKPAEWLFYLSLLLLDRGPPEARIDRMYR